jgi:hypothetical protein
MVMEMKHGVVADHKIAMWKQRYEAGADKPTRAGGKLITSHKMVTKVTQQGGGRG